MAENRDDEINSISLWWHSHKTMSTFFSNTDDKTIEGWPGDYLVALVINRKGELKAQVMTRTPVQTVVDIDVVINYFDDAEYPKWKKNAEDKVTIVKYTPGPKKEPNSTPVQSQKYGPNYKHKGYSQMYDDAYDDWEVGKSISKPKSFHEMTDEEFAKAMEEIDAGVVDYLGEATELKKWWDEDKEKDKLKQEPMV